MKRFSFRALAALAVTAFSAILWLGAGALPAHAQATPPEITDAGLGAVGETIKLSNASPTTIAVRIINIALSLIGIILVSIVMYAGFLWMTSGGDATKIEKAKKYLQNAIIGLVIILSAWAITKFIISALLDATGNDGGNGTSQDGQTPGGSFGTPGTSGGFILEGVTPNGSVPLRNIKVRFLFSRPVNVEDVNTKIRVVTAAGNEPVAGRFEVSQGLVIFTPAAACPAPNADRFCFDGNTEYLAKVDASMRSASGQTIACGGLGAVCQGRFRTGELVDVAPPTVTLLQPYNGQSLPQNQLVELIGQANDDSGVSVLDFAADGQSVGRSTPALSVTPTSFEGRVNWNTEGVALGRHQLQATAFDVDSNQTESAAVSVMIRPQTCFDGTQNGDETGIDVGGACGGALGGSCTEGAECASGICSEGICVARPVITAITPNNGRVGTIITISGANFGAAGEVTFTGGVRASVPAVCVSIGSGWSDRSIVVEVPVGAQTGPITVKNTASNLTDGSDDGVGPRVGAYTVNTASYPGLCGIVPNRGPIGAPIALSGAGFGSSSDRVRVGDAVVSAFRGWTDQNISLNIPAVQNGTMSVRAVVGETMSNPVPLRVEITEATAPPIIESIEPATGPVGEYITIRGRNFGNAAGTIRVAGPAGAEGNGDTAFPPACDQATRYWSDRSITFKVPASLRGAGLGAPTVSVSPGAFQVFVQRPDGSSPSNREGLEVTLGAPSPGLCAVTPDVGPSGTEIRLNGERFGSSQGQVTFDGSGVETDAVSILEWTDQQVRAYVPAGARTGSVFVKKSAQPSNPLPYRVQNCNEDASICSVSQRCCAGSGVCVAQAGGVCPAVATDAHYAWRMSTGELTIFPEVVNECNPASRRLASPSPSASRPGGDQACVNTDLIIRFTTKLDASQVNGNTLKVRQCADATGDCSNGTVIPAAVGFPRVEAADTETDLIRFRPSINSERWSPASFYRVVLTTGITSDRGVAMPERAADCGEDNAYCFRFGTRPSSELCAVGSVLVNPSNYRFTDFEQDVGVHANPLAADDSCLQLNPDSYAWSWGVVDRLGRNDARATVTTNAGRMGMSADQVATSHAEIDESDPALATATVMVGRAAVSGNARLSVALRPFTVEAYGPNCNTACVNAAIWARLSGAVQVGTVNPSNIVLRRCVDSACRTMDDPFTLGAGAIRVTAVPGTTGAAGLGRFLLIDPSPSLRPGQTYRIVLRSGAAGGIVSSRGQSLVSLNDPQGFGWNFTVKTADVGRCTVDRVALAPGEKIETAIGARQRFTAVPVSLPTACSDSGEYLISDRPYAWSVVNNAGAPDTGVARLVQRTDDETLDGAPNDDAAPVRAGMSTEDQQLAEINATQDPGQGQTRLLTNVQATYESRSGRAVYGLLCGQRLESACPAGTGLTEGGCCAPRPTVESRYPTVGGTEVCRNTEIFANFNVLMNGASASNENVILAKRVSAVTCPATTTPLASALVGETYHWYERVWDRVVALFRADTANADVWCVGAIPGRIEVSTEGTVSRVTYRIENALEANTQYRLFLRGETDFTRTASPVLKSARGVRMAQEASEWTFTTGSSLCAIDRLQVSDTSAESPYLYTKHPETHAWSASVQAISPAGALVPITPVREYTWAWGPWLSSKPDVLTTALPDARTPQRANATENNKNGQSYVSARFQITHDEITVPSTTGRVVESARNAIVNLCERPWPNLSLGGFTDGPNSASLRALAPLFGSGPFYNFSTTYCMDAGAPGAPGDLAPLRLNAVPLTTNDISQGILRQYLFSFEEPSLRGDGIGIRIAQNPLHLNASRWYASRGFTGTPQALTVDGYEAVRDGNTVYITASNLETTGGTVESVVYIVSRNPNATASTSAIFDQLVANFTLNVNLTQDTGNVCVSPQPAGGSVVFLQNSQPVSCTADWECGRIQTTLRCGSAKAKLQRDRVRISDFQTFNAKLETAKQATGRYPQVQTGSFIQGMSTSRWPSWGQSFASELSGAVPLDPVNRFQSCGRCQTSDRTLMGICSDTSECSTGQTCVAMTGADAARNGFDPATCWNPTSQRYLCPAVQQGGRTVQASHVYQYRSIDQGARYELATTFEGTAATLYRPTLLTSLRRCTNVDRICSADTDCNVTVPAGSTIAATGSCRDTGGTWIYGGSCLNTEYAAASSCTATGPLGEGQVCRTGDTRATSCQVNGAAGTKIQVCSDCRAFADGPQTVCTPNVSCGNGRVDAGETCDDGAANNGRYGFCSRTCRAPQGACGDGVIGGGETCDNGLGTPVAGTSGVNGQYCGVGCTAAQSCSLDCRGRAPTCGDRVVDGPEQCDGNTTQTAGKLCVNETDEGVRVLGSPCTQDSECGGGRCGENDSRATACGMQQVFACSGGTNPGAACTATGNECQGGGRCVGLSYQSYHVRTCNAAGSTNQCRFNDWSACQILSSCGDGVVDAAGGEECDDGLSGNSGTGRCTPRCKLNQCGDGFVQRGTEDCDNGQRNGIPSRTLQYSSPAPICSTSCRYASVSGGYCGNNVIEAEEACDGTSVPLTASCRAAGHDYATDSPGGRDVLSCNARCDLAGCQKCSVRLAQTENIISAKVVDGILQANGLPQARVVLKYNGAFVGETFTDTTGVFRFGGIHDNTACGNYTIEISLQGRKYDYANPSRGLQRSADPNDGYRTYVSPSFSKGTFDGPDGVVGRQSGSERVILLSPLPGEKETIVIREWNNTIRGRNGYVGQLIDPQLVLPLQMGYTPATPSAPSRRCSTEAGCEHNIMWDRHIGSLNMSVPPSAGLACFSSQNASATGGCTSDPASAASAIAETIMYKRLNAIAGGKYRYFLVDFVLRDAATDGSLDTAELKNVVRIAWRDAQGVQNYQEVSPAGREVPGGQTDGDDGACRKYWHVFDQDAVTGRITIVNRFMCNYVGNEARPRQYTQITNDAGTAVNVDGFLQSYQDGAGY